MKKAALFITVFAALIGTSSVSFGDTKCNKGLTVRDGFATLFPLKTSLAVDTQNGAGDSLKNDPRKELDRKANPEYNPIGTVKTSLGRGSAWLAHECLVVTAKHNIGSDENIIGKKVTFSVGQTSNRTKDFEDSVEGEVVASGNPDAKDPDAGAQDWAIVRIKKNLGKKYGYIEPAKASLSDVKACKSLDVPGFPGEKDVKKLWAQRGCGLYEQYYDQTAFHVNCPITKGNSGGPLVCRLADNSLVAVGLMNQKVSTAKMGIAVNFDKDWSNFDAAYSKYLGTCGQD